MMPCCSFCGRLADACPGGLWHLNFGRQRQPGDPAICRYCLRTGIRALGEQPDPKPVEPVSIFSRRMGLLRLSGEGTST